MIERTHLGRTGIKTSRLGLGGTRLTDDNLDSAIEAINLALDMGVNFIDTAPAYGVSEKLLGMVLGDRADDIIVSTKLGGRPSPFDPRDGRALINSVEESLRLLRREHTDILYIHEPDRKREYAWWTDEVSYQGLSSTP